MTPTKPGKNEGGFTLISVLIAIVMLSVGLVALARSQAMLMTTQNRLANANTALSIARGYVEQVRGRDPWTLATEAPVAVDELGIVAANGTYRRSMDVTLDATNLARVTVTVTFPRQSQPVQVITLIYRGIP
ncbi:MAG TPA: prepilin-type N-terminal cleavage/methylation domain-containing protein [Gemmatimonadales bacterium]|jgi:type IV pilus assembly protein PilV